MLALLRPLAMAAILGAAAWVWISCAQLPAWVATKLPRNAAAHFQLRASYQAFMAAATLLAPGLLLLFQAWLPRRFPRLANIPYREHWLAPERREAALAFLESVALAEALLVAGWFAGFHALILKANAGRPPRFDGGAMALLTTALVLGVLAAPIAIALRFRRP